MCCASLVFPGGSIRVPAAFNGIVGLRTLPGVIPIYPSELAWDTITSHVHGPFARLVDDICLTMSVLGGPDPRDPRIKFRECGMDPDHSAIMTAHGLGPGDRINLTPMWFGWAGGKIYFYGRGQKVVNLRRNAACSCVVLKPSWRRKLPSSVVSTASLM